MDGLIQDIRYAARALRRSWLVTLLAAASLALAIAGNTTIFSLVSALIFVLLIACANVANILLARGHDRRHDLAIRAALGASRHRTVRLLLTESLLLAVGAGLAGCLLAVWGVRLLWVVVAEQLPRSMTPEMDGLVLVLGLGFGVSVFAGLLCGLAPTLQASRPNVTAELRQGAHGAGSPHRLLARGLVVAMEGREFTHADRRDAKCEGVWLAALGFALGVPGVWLVSRLVQNALFGVSPRTSGTVVLAGLALFLVAVVVSYVPARRAASVEPMLARRSE
jgi:ABC-type antimicrobial peptide transport system permease subunit